jgi:hypothetical protein
MLQAPTLFNGKELMTNGGREGVCASIIGYFRVVELYLNIKI